MKLAGCIILYNPNMEIIHNISTYIEQLDILYCIDNSLKPNKQLINVLKNNPKIRYITMDGNVGLALALSYACEVADKDGYEYILTMDQDTEFESDSLQMMKEFSDANGERYSIISPNIKLIVCNNEIKTKSSDALYATINEEPSWVITSGSMIRLEDYKQVGGFDKKLFIGQIDQDYCCNLYSHNKKIMRLGKAYIYQDAGNTKTRSFLWKNIKLPQYDSTRYYFIFRNEVYLRGKWGHLYSEFKAPLLKYLIIIVAYDKDKISKIRAIFKGLKESKKLK